MGMERRVNGFQLKRTPYRGRGGDGEGETESGKLRAGWVGVLWLCGEQYLLSMFFASGFGLYGGL